ncbi:MAG: hypothetical protein ACOYMF_09845 [Bacteroidales bacterium]
MSSKKVKESREALEIAVNKVKETQAILEAAHKEEEDILSKATDQINNLLQVNNLFCGAIILKEDLLSIIDLALTSNGEPVTIPFKLYFNPT